MRNRIRGGLLSVFVRTLIGAAIGFGLGLIAQAQFPMLNPTVTIPLGISITWLATAIWRARQGRYANVTGWWLVWLGTLAWLGRALAPVSWQWWMGPSLGAGIGILATVAWVVLAQWRSSSQGHPQAKPAQGQTQSNPGAAKVTNVSQQLAATLGLPVGSGAQIDIGELTKALQDRAKAEAISANAQMLAEIRQLVQMGVLQADQVAPKICELCGVEMPRQEQAAPAPQPSRSRVTEVRGMEYFRPR